MALLPLRRVAIAGHDLLPLRQDDLPDAIATARFDKATRNGEEMAAVQKQLATAVAAITGKKEERAVASLFTPGGTHAMKGEFAGIDDFEVVAYLVVLSESDA